MATLNVDQLVQYAYAAGYHGLELAAIVAIALAESGGQTDVINNTAYPDRPGYKSPGPGAIPEYSGGPLQINIGPGAHNYTVEQITNPAEAFRIAYSDFGSNFGQWSTYTSTTNPSSRFLPQVAAAISRLFGSGPPAPAPEYSAPPSPPRTDSQPFPATEPTLEQRFGVSGADVLASSRAHGGGGGGVGPEMASAEYMPAGNPDSSALPVSFPDIPNPLDAVSGVGGAIKDAFAPITDLIVWLMRPEHWWRMFFIGAGGVLIIVGLGIYLRDTAVDVASMTPQGAALKAVA